MKKLAVLSFIFLISIPAFSQDKSDKGGGGIGLGIKAGVNFAGLTEVSGFNIDSRTGFLVGAYIPIMFSNKFGIQPEIMFSSQGSEIESDVNKYNYVNIPLMFNFRLINFLQLQAGPQIGFLTSAEVGGEDVKEFLNSTDLSLALGAEVLLPLGITAGARYTIGLTDINDGFPAFDDEVQHRVFQLYAGLKILGKR